MIPFDERKPMETSGLRLGSPALSTRGMGGDEMRTVAGMIDGVLSSQGAKATIDKVRGEVVDLCAQFPVHQH
jgi:glycine hydroxymethyltransferase